jgi:hypothetical protein
MTSGTSPAARDIRLRWLLVVTAALAVLALMLLSDWAHLLMPVVKPDKAKPLDDLIKAINSIKAPATAAFSAVSGLGLLAGGAMTAMGMPQGIRMMTMSGLSGGGVLLGNGIVA